MVMAVSYSLVPPPSLGFLPCSRPLNCVSLSFSSRTLVRVRNSPAPLRVLSMRQSRASAVTGASWNTLILNSKMPVLVEFYTSWCGPCQMVHRVIDEITAEYAGKLNCFILNADFDPQVAENYNVKAVPVVLLFKNGKKCESVVGTMPKEFYEAAIERVLAS